LLGLAVGLTLWAIWWTNPFHAERIEQIQKGMSEEEVVALLGVPPGNYVRQSTWERIRPNGLKRFFPLDTKSWIGEGKERVVYLNIRFDEEGRVAEKYCYDEEVRSPFRHALRRWLGP
jgi:outer membrane protein assembly factor BamE (lipoprotein component of BamABCDE complex)